MIEIAVLFLHHNCNEVVRQNFASFKRWSSPVIPIAAGEEKLDGSWSLLDDHESRWYTVTRGGQPDHAWANADLAIYAWALAHQPAASYYLIADWDMYASCDPHSYLRPVKSYDCSAPLALRYEQIREWWWFQQMPALMDFAPYACGVAPLCGTIVSERCLRAIIGADIRSRLDCFSELRMGTLANACGFPPVSNPEGRTVLWQKKAGVDYRRRGLHHPVKEVLPSVPESCMVGAGEIA